MSRSAGPAQWFRGHVARRVAVAFAAVAVAAAALTALVVNAAFGAQFTSYLTAQQQARAQQVVTLVTADYQAQGGWRRESLDRLAPGLQMSGSTVEVLGSDGRPVWSLADAGGGSSMTAMRRDMMGTPTLGPSTRSPVTVAGDQVGTVVVRVPVAAAPVADQQFRDGINRLLLAAALGAGAVALLVGLLLARRGVRPLAELTAAADELAAGRRDRRVAVTSDDELGRLARSFNAMADAVDREDELRQAFAADIAHELRTPLAVLQGQLESIQDGITAPDSLIIDSLHEESLRMGRLVADLETLAEAGAAGFGLRCREVALRPLVVAVLDGLSTFLAEHQTRVTRELEEITVIADPVRISQVITNLVTNAATWTPPGGTVTVTLAQSGTGVELVVADTGPGIPVDELPRVFDRFFRGAAAPPGGSGIGLAVASELVGAHTGTLTVSSEPGRGSRFRIWLPPASSGSSATLHQIFKTAP